MTMMADTLIGIEQVQREALYVVMDSLDSAFDAIEQRWELADAELAARRGVPYEATVLERVLPENFHEGHTPSLINTEVSRYPNVAVMCLAGSPGGESAELDHGKQYDLPLTIDIMVKSMLSEGEVNRRAHRSAEAVALCVNSNPTLNGTVAGLSADPSIDISDVFLRRDKEKGHYGQEWFWQGARITYVVRRYAGSVASSADGFFRSAGINIDQA